MLSRVANSIYWINRYIERAENYARFIDVNFNLALDTPSGSQWKPIISTTADDQLFDQLYPEATQENVINFLTFDERNPNSILSCLSKARENARTVRENISIEMWEHINRYYFSVKDAVATREVIMRSPREFFKEIKYGSQLLLGIMSSTITHSEGWHFGKLGRYIERADQTARFIDVKYFIILPTVESIGSTIDLLQWSAVLKSASAYMMYRRQYGQLSPQKIVEFLLLDKRFPRSILYCLMHTQASLKAISRFQHTSTRNLAMKRIAILSAELYYTDVNEVIASGLHEYLYNLQIRLNEVNQAVYETFFTIKD